MQSYPVLTINGYDKKSLASLTEYLGPQNNITSYIRVCREISFSSRTINCACVIVFSV